MLYSSKHVAGHQGLINPDVSFNNVLLLSWSTVTDTRIHGPKANCTNCSAYIQEKIAIIHNVLTNQYTILGLSPKPLLHVMLTVLPL